MRPRLVGAGLLGDGLVGSLGEIFEGFKFSSVGSECWARSLTGNGSNPFDGSLGRFVADLGEAEGLTCAKSFAGYRQANPSCGPLDCYAVWPVGDEQVRQVFCPEGPFQRTFVFFKTLKAEDVGETISKVLRVHGLWAGTREPGAGAGSRFVGADAWAFPLASRSPAEGHPLRNNDEHLALIFRRTILPAAFKAVELVVEDIRSRIEEALPKVDFAQVKELEVFDRILTMPLDFVRGFSHEKDSGQASTEAKALPAFILPDSTQINGWLSRLPRGAEASELIALASQSFEQYSIIDQNAIKGFLSTLNEPTQHDLSLIRSNLGRLPESISAIGREEDLKWSSEKRPYFRERVRNVCTRLIRILETQLLRRNLLECLILAAKEEKKPEEKPGTLSAPAPNLTNGSLDAVKGELREIIPKAQGERAYLILPDGALPAHEQEALRAWVETMLGRVCELLPGKDSQGWLYLERKIDPCVEPWVSPERPAEPRPCKEHEVPQTPSPPSPPSATSCRSPEPCPACGSAEADPEIAPPEPDCQSHHGKKVPPLRCPQCGRLNAKAWWLCRKHGKIALPIPIDKVRCPECILRHHRDPVQYPLSSVGVKPGYHESHPCPNCENLQDQDPERCVYVVSEKLMPFYLNGVNGHDSVRFKDVAREAKLLDYRYCPVCGTLLIPVNHRWKGHPATGRH